MGQRELESRSNGNIIQAQFESLLQEFAQLKRENNQMLQSNLASHAKFKEYRSEARRKFKEAETSHYFSQKEMSQEMEYLKGEEASLQQYVNAAWQKESNAVHYYLDDNQPDDSGSSHSSSSSSYIQAAGPTSAIETSPQTIFSAAFDKDSQLTASVFDSISAIGSDHASNVGNSTAQGNAVPASTAPAASVKVKTKAKEAESIQFSDFPHATKFRTWLIDFFKTGTAHQLNFRNV